MSSKKGHRYDATSIQVLPGIEAVRKRPAMYIGDTSTRGFHHLLEEVVANSVDEAMGGFCDRINVCLHDDGSATVTDNGRGIPVDLHKEMKVPAVEVVMTTLHAGGKFNHESYRVSGGLHGVGVSVVNALSEWVEVEIHRDGQGYRQEYERGAATSKLEPLGASTSTGTRTRFRPDREIFGEQEFAFDVVTPRLRELAFLNRGLTIQLRDERTQKDETFCYQGGLQEFIRHLNEGKSPLHEDVIHVQQEESGIYVEVAMQYHRGYTESLFSFANNINTMEGGTHLSGFKSALTRTLNHHARKLDLLKNDRAPQGEDLREGLTAVISVKVPEPQFEGQTKTKLGNREVEGVVQAVVNTWLGTYLEEHPAIARLVLSKGLEAAAAREAARRARELARRKTALASGDLPTKLADCSSRQIEETELFIVEGDSAGGNAKQCRDSRFQAILPLRGKILNVEKARLDTMLKSDAIQTLISSIGTGIGVSDFHLERLRYGKLIIMADADVDGLHIRTLLLTFLYRQMPQLITEGRVYIAQPPLYGVRRRNKTQYFLNDEELQAALSKLGLEGSVLHDLARDRRLDGPALAGLVRQLQQLQAHQRFFLRHNLNFREYVARGKDGVLPEFVARQGEGYRYFFSRAEVDAYLHQAEPGAPEAGREAEAGSEAEAERVAPDLEVLHLREGRKIASALEEIQKLDFSLEELFAPDDPEAPPRFRLVSDKETLDLAALEDLPGAIRTLGEQGLDIQRYKGLGEMNPGQLGDTTMDPEKRVLLRVTLGDATEADRMFALLLGSTVAPRRQYIEQHALEATNLDLHG